MTAVWPAKLKMLALQAFAEKAGGAPEQRDQPVRRDQHVREPAGARGARTPGARFPPGLIRPHPPQLLPRPFHREVNRGMERGLLSSATQQEVFSTDEHHPSDSEARTPPAHAPTHLQTPPLRSAPPRSDVAGPVTSRLWDEHLVRGAPGSPRPSHRGTTW